MIENVSFTVSTFFAISAILALLITLLGIRQSKKFVISTIIVLAFVAFLPISYISFNELLGRPKPTNLLLLEGAKEAEVYGFKLVENEAIYVYISLPDKTEPLSIVLPWDFDQANQLRKAAEEAAKQNSGRRTRMRLRMEPTIETREPMFYNPPQRALPPKRPPRNPAMRFDPTQTR